MSLNLNLKVLGKLLAFKYVDPNTIWHNIILLQRIAYKNKKNIFYKK